MWKEKLRTIFAIALLAAMLGLAGCGGGGGGGALGTSPPATKDATPTAASLILSSSVASIKPDGSNSTTITATVVDVNRSPVKDATVKFTAEHGTLGASSGPSSATGEVTIPYSAAGMADTSEHEETITATVVGAGIPAATIRIKISSSSMLISLGTSTHKVKSDGSDSATLTATVTDLNFVPVPGVTVGFTKGTGQLGASSGPSSAAGVVTILFSAVAYDANGAPIDKTNRTEMITATIAGTATSARIPIDVSGSSMTLASGGSSIAQVGGAITLIAVAKDAAGVGVAGRLVEFTSNCTDPVLTNCAAVSFNSISPWTTSDPDGSRVMTVTADKDGIAKVALVGNQPGDVNVTAKWFGSSPAIKSSSTFAVTSEVVSLVSIDPAPTAVDPISLSLGVARPISVKVTGTTVKSVRFATTLGTWVNNNNKVFPVANLASPNNQEVSATLNAGSSSGIASVQIDALDGSGKVLATLNRTFAISPDISAATKISLQPSSATVPPSTGGTTNSTTLAATVRDAANNLVANVPVLFELVNPSGGGESVSPVIAYSDSNGRAFSTFTAGTRSTIGGVRVKASTVGTAANCNNLVGLPDFPVVAVLAGACDVKLINVAGDSVSVTVGRGNVINSTNSNTTYELPMSVLVVSSTGGAISGATVTLSAFPTHYYRGIRDDNCVTQFAGARKAMTLRNGQKIDVAVVDANGNVIIPATTAFPNEDVDENDILDTDPANQISSTNFLSGEDYDPIGDGLGAGTITPPRAAAGTLPSSVVTDKNGVATFSLVYLKNYAEWVNSRIRAKTVVNGTEYVNDLNFKLDALNDDLRPVCTMPRESPFGKFGP